MTNTELLNRIIKESGLKMSFICERMGMSRQLLWKKINNQQEFKASEIVKLCNILNINESSERDCIFFN